VHHGAHGAQVGYCALQLADRLGQVLDREQRHRPQALRRRLPEVVHRRVVGARHGRSVVGIADHAQVQAERGEEDHRVDALHVHVGQGVLRALGLPSPIAAARAVEAVGGVDLVVALRVVGRREILTVQRWPVQIVPVGVDDRDSGLHRSLPLVVRSLLDPPRGGILLEKQR
jgi:hypothetical protein